jgi:hypothetical protein
MAPTPEKSWTMFLQNKRTSRNKTSVNGHFQLPQVSQLKLAFHVFIHGVDVRITIFSDF